MSSTSASGGSGKRKRDDGNRASGEDGNQRAMDAFEALKAENPDFFARVEGSEPYTPSDSLKRALAAIGKVRENVNSFFDAREAAGGDGRSAESDHLSKVLLESFGDLRKVLYREGLNQVPVGISSIVESGETEEEMLKAAQEKIRVLEARKREMVTGVDAILKARPDATGERR